MHNNTQRAMYGVKQLIMINSGTVEYIQLDLGIPLHLSAENNIGKTSTVNTLQFLYIDKMDEMFMPSSVQHSVDFYFRDEYSYLIFECISKSGTHCVVFNRTPGSRRYYNRYILKGKYEQDFFIGADSRPYNWGGVLDVLAEREVNSVSVSNKEWWRVLSGLTDKKSKKEIPSLFILPVKDLESYHRFKMIYRNLLSMSSIKLDTFKDILLSCAVASGEKRKIDFAEKEYKSRFDHCRKLQLQHEYYLTHEQEILKLKEEEKELLKFQRKLPVSFALLDYNYNIHNERLSSESKKAETRLAGIEEDNNNLIKEREQLSLKLGGMTKELEDIQKELSEYNSLEQNSDLFVCREKWSLKEFKIYKEDLDRDYFTLDEQLKDVKKYRRNELESRVQRIQIEIDKCRHILENENFFFEWLLKEGVAENDLVKLASLFQMELLTRPMKDVNIKNKESFLKNINALTENISDNYYNDNTIGIALLQHKINELTDREEVDERLKGLENEMSDASKLLDLYIQEESNLHKLADIAQKRVLAVENLKSYERFNILEENLPKLKKNESDMLEENDKLSIRKTTCEQMAEDLHVELEELRTSLSEMNSSLRLMNGDYSRLNSTINQHFSNIVAREIKFKEEDYELDYLIDELSFFTHKIENLSSDLQKIMLRKSQILEKVGLIYDQEKDWGFFIDANADTKQADKRLDKEWQTFFGLAKHDFRSLVQCVDSIQSLLRSIDRTFSRQRISNLSKFKVGIESNDIYREAREFTNDSDDLFTDLSQRRIYTSMFQKYFSKQVTDLRAEDMFHIQIEVSNPNNPGENKNITSFENESEGTNYTIKALLLSQLLKEQFKFGLYQENIVFHYYLDEIGQLDKKNLSNIVKQNQEKNLISITAAPQPVIEPLCHPRCKVVTLMEHPKSKLTYIANEKTFTAEQINDNLENSASEDKNE